MDSTIRVSLGASSGQGVLSIACSLSNIHLMKIATFFALPLIMAACVLGGPDASVEPGCRISESDASRRATAFLGEQEVSWGRAESSMYDEEEKTYTFYYPTPGEEIGLLGERGVFVDCISGDVRFIPRF